WRAAAGVGGAIRPTARAPGLGHHHPQEPRADLGAGRAGLVPPHLCPWPALCGPQPRPLPGRIVADPPCETGPHPPGPPGASGSPGPPVRCPACVTPCILLLTVKPSAPQAGLAAPRPRLWPDQAVFHIMKLSPGFLFFWATFFITKEGVMRGVLNSPS